MGEFLLPFYFLIEIKCFIVVFTNDCFNIIPRKNKFFFFFFFLWSRVIDRALLLYKECLKKHHMTPTEPFTLSPRFVAKDYGAASTLLTLQTKKVTGKDIKGLNLCN